MDLRAREAEVPVACHGFGRWEAGVAVVEGRYGEADVSSEDDAS